MSVETTNTPNGASNLYEKNNDIDKQELNITDLSEKNPAIDLTKNIPGDNTITEVSISLDNTTVIRDFGSVTIGTVAIGNPMISSPETKNAIKLSVEQVKKALLSRGAITIEAYNEAKKERAERENEENKLEQEENEIDEK